MIQIQHGPVSPRPHFSPTSWILASPTVAASHGRCVSRGWKRWPAHVPPIHARIVGASAGRGSEASRLFLRSFSDDAVVLAAPPSGFAYKLFGYVDRKKSLDELLLEEGTTFGPVVALGNPTDAVPPYGAARGYAKHSDWQKMVSDLDAPFAACGILKACEIIPAPPLAVERELAVVSQPRALETLKCQCDHPVAGDARNGLPE
jgi:hypothetical protein